MRFPRIICNHAAAWVVLLIVSSPCAAGLIVLDEASSFQTSARTLGGMLSAAEGLSWFDETGGGRGYGTFAELAKAHKTFLAGADEVIDFNDLAAGTTLGDQYAQSHGVRFVNTAKGRYHKWCTIHEEGNSYVEALTGYDGSYMPDGDKVVLRFDNHVPGTVFTILFDKPVWSVGAFLAVGVQGEVHSVKVSVYGVDDRLLGVRDVETWLWESSAKGQNYESFFGVSADGPVIGRMELLNNSGQDYSNALVLDHVSFSRRWGSLTTIPEPMTASFLVLGLCGLAVLRRSSF